MGIFLDACCVFGVAEHSAAIQHKTWLARRMEGNNEKCYFAIPSCDHSFPCFEWLWAKSISHCHPRSAYICAAYADTCTTHADIGAVYTYTDTHAYIANTHTDACAVYINTGTTYTDTAREDHSRH